MAAHQLIKRSLLISFARRFIAVVFVTTFLATVLIPTHKPLAADARNIEHLKTALIYNFLRNIQWPNEKKLKTYHIGLYGTNEALFNELKKTAEQVKFKSHPLSIERLKSPRFDATKFQVILVSSDAAGLVPSIARHIRRTNTLLITIGSENKQDFMINITQPDAKHLSFEVNKSNIVYELLTMNKDILLLGGTELDVAELFRENEQRLNNIREELANRQIQLLVLEKDVKDKQLLLTNKNNLIKEQTVKAKEQEFKLIARKKELLAKSQLITNREEKLGQLSGELASATQLLLEKQNVLKRSQYQLDSNLVILEDREQKVESLTSIIERNNNILENQSINLTKQQEELKQKSTTISQQRGWLLFFSLGMIIFTILMVVISVIDRARKRSNEKLTQTLDQLNHAKEDADLARQQAEEASRSKGTFLANMSHEIRTPMNAILGFTELMQREMSVTEEQKFSLNIINSASNHLLALIDDILDISKIESGQISAEFSPLNLKSMLQDMEQMFRIRANSKDLSLEFKGLDTLPEVIISDEAKIRQIIINLLGNAIKFTKQGGVICQTSNIEQTDNKINLKIVVTDTGPGIPEQENHKVFAAFEQTDTGQQTEGGTGLGMAISRKYARLLGGDIQLESQVGVGSSFYFTLAVEKSQTLATKGNPQEIDKLSTGQSQMKILLVDDQQDNRSLVIKMLEPMGFVIVEAQNGEEAINQFETEHPDLILMDKRMPVMDGLEATKRIKATSAGQNTPIIAMTAHAFEEERKVILAQGADGFLRKPFRRHILLTMIGKHLNLHYDYVNADRESTSDNSLNQPEESSSSQAGTLDSNNSGNNTNTNNVEVNSNKKILIVDDVKANRLLLKLMLTREGYCCEEAKNGIEALTMLEKWQPNIVLLDIQMPEMNGYEVLEKVATDKVKGVVPIFALTADNDSAERMKLKSMGAKDVFCKPLAHDKLLESISRELALAQTIK